MCRYTKAQSLGNKQEEVELCMYLQSYSIIGITRMWWDRLTGLRCYNRCRLFRRDREDEGGLSSA